MDVIEIDGASNTGVEDVRALQREIMYAPQNSRYKIYIIDESKIPRKYMIPDMVVIRQALMEGTKVPGTEVRIERTVAKGRK